MIQNVKNNYKAVLANGAGAGIGVVQILTLKQNDAPIPVIGDYIPYPWGNWSTLGNMIAGGIAFGLSLSNIIQSRSAFLNEALQVYGITTLFGGIASGILDSLAGLPAFTATRNGYYTQEYYPDAQGMFYRRPESRARGFGSDIRQNPMASIATKVPYNKVIF